MIRIPETSSTLLEGKKFIDLFAGLGGFRLALESLGAECVWSNEIDRYAAETYLQNFGEDPTGDITKVEAKDVPDHDIICAGFPCQPFSVSGRQRGFEDSRGTLFFDVARIIKEKKPEMVFLENVRNFAMHDGGKTIATVEATMKQLGYSFAWKMMPSNKYGAATKRDRVYMVCFRNDLNVTTFDFPSECKCDRHVKDFLLDDSDPRVKDLYRDDVTVQWEPDVLDKQNEIMDKPVRLGIVGNGGQGERIYSINGTAITFSAHGGGIFARSGGYKIGERVRPLAADECAHIMGFPATYHMHGRRSQAMRQIGNSVVVDVLQRVAIEMAKAYREAEARSFQKPDKISE